MNDNVETTETKTKTLRSKSVARKAGKIAMGTDEAVMRKRRSKLANKILRQISNGEIENPKAVARAYFKGSRQGRKAAAAESTAF